jgi:hypothetical protein
MAFFIKIHNFARLGLVVFPEEGSLGGKRMGTLIFPRNVAFF